VYLPFVVVAMGKAERKLCKSKNPTRPQPCGLTHCFGDVFAAVGSHVTFGLSAQAMLWARRPHASSNHKTPLPMFYGSTLSPIKLGFN
jgi:hypothetical protein